MKINVHNKLKSEKGLLVVPIFKEDLNKNPATYPKAIKDFIKSLVKNKEFEGKRGEIITTYFEKKGIPRRLLITGLGEKERYKSRHSRRVGGTIGKKAKSMKTEEIHILIPKELVEHTEEMLEGLLLSQYEIDKLKTKKDKKSYQLKKLDVISDTKSKKFKLACERAEYLAEAAEFVKDLVNFPSNIVDADYLEAEARQIAKDNRYKIEVYKNKELKKMGWGGLLAVNQGADHEAQAIIIQFDGAGKSEKPIVLVGKGVIFDTGGYNLKPTRSIETMHQDMAGGATVLGVMKVLKKLKIKRNVIAVIPIAENLISSKSYRPSDVITMLSGHTVEITNTDAEGRLILADGIAYGTKFNPEAIITISTLTGAVGVALGNRYAGLVGNDKPLRLALKKAGSETDDRGWPLPLINEYRKKMDSKIADITNYDMGTGRYGGTIKAAAFLERFVDGNKWCQIDIGGTAFSDDPLEYQQTGATAHGLRMLIRFLENKA